jgi:hypothetical protein
MPQKPTCKVVKRQGQTGARIDPKGCKVRSEKDAAGTVTTTNKQGQRKHKVRELNRDHFLFISGKKPSQATVRSNWNNKTPAQKATFGAAHRILYDTGAMGTLMTRTLLRKLGENPDRTNNIAHTMMSGATGGPVSTKILKNVTYWVLIGKTEWVKIKDDVMVASGTHNLFGTSAIRQLGNKYKVKFK